MGTTIRIIIFGFLCIIVGCVTSVTTIPRQNSSWEKLQCHSTYLVKQERLRTIEHVLYSYETLGDHTKNQIRCMVSKNFNSDFLKEERKLFKSLTFYNESTKEGLIYYFGKSGHLKVTVISKKESGDYEINKHEYRGPFEEMVAVFDRGSVYMPHKFKRGIETSYTNEKVLPYLYLEEGGFKLE